MKKFVFETMEAECVGDLYRYTVEANTKDEAFEKLVKYFFSKDMIQPVESEHLTVSYPSLRKFEYTGMPYWFAKRITGWRFDWVYGWFGGKRKESYQERLEEYAREHNIKLEER